MVSKNKLYKKLDALELELRERIIPHLEIASSGKNSLVFCVTPFNTFTELKNQTDKTTEELVELGVQILALKKKVQESSEDSIAERICWYCRQWAAESASRRRDAKGLAQAFLDEIRSRHM